MGGTQKNSGVTVAVDATGKRAALGQMAASMAIFGTVGIFIKQLPFPSAVIAL